MSNTKQALGNWGHDWAKEIQSIQTLKAFNPWDSGSKNDPSIGPDPCP